MQAHDLVSEAKQLIEKAEEDIRDLEHVETTQLRIAVNRLHLFNEHVAKLRVVEPVIEPQVAPEAKDSERDPPVKRGGRPAKAKAAEGE